MYEWGRRPGVRMCGKASMLSSGGQQLHGVVDPCSKTCYEARRAGWDKLARYLERSQQTPCPSGGSREGWEGLGHFWGQRGCRLPRPECRWADTRHEHSPGHACGCLANEDSQGCQHGPPAPGQRRSLINEGAQSEASWCVSLAARHTTTQAAIRTQQETKALLPAASIQQVTPQ